jgi:hypothetical protein
MNTDNILQELLRQKRSYESLLAMNSFGKHTAVDGLLKEHLQIVLRSIENLQQHRS